MNTTLDNKGAYIALATRQGIDFLLQVGVDTAAGTPMDLTGYQVIAQLDDGITLHDLEATIAVDIVSVRISHDLTATLPAISRYSVELVSPTDLRSGLLYGPVSTDASYP